MDLVLVYEGDQGTWTRRSFAKTKIEARYQGFLFCGSVSYRGMFGG